MANKAKEHQTEALRKIYFRDAWRVRSCARCTGTLMACVERWLLPSWHPCLPSSSQTKQGMREMTSQGLLSMPNRHTGDMDYCPSVQKPVSPRLQKWVEFLPFRAKEEGTSPILEPNRNALSLTQTVVMSFGRNLCLGKADLPINHVHVYFPVHIVHKLVERCCALGLQDVAPEEGKRYERNSENETNNPCIIVRAHEGQCVSENYPTVPPTPQLARANKQGILDGSFGQMIFFASSCKSAFSPRGASMEKH